MGDRSVVGCCCCCCFFLFILPFFLYYFGIKYRRIGASAVFVFIGITSTDTWVRQAMNGQRAKQRCGPKIWIINRAGSNSFVPHTYPGWAAMPSEWMGKLIAAMIELQWMGHFRSRLMSSWPTGWLTAWPHKLKRITKCRCLFYRVYLLLCRMAH